MEPHNIPNHLAIIVDGNRRWARQHNQPSYIGHKYGFERLEKSIDYVVTLGVSYISLFVFSTENFQRDAQEINYLMNLFRKNFYQMSLRMKESNIKAIFSGRRADLPTDIIDSMDHLVSTTRDCTSATVNFCLNYGGKAEIVDACKAIVREINSKMLCVQDIDETLFAQHLYADLPPIDLLIRTSGELRISNFMLWQSAYSEMYFTDVLFPDFDEGCLDEAIKAYQCRNRRFGGDSQI
ncbi:MAG: polyprenyl diphosphate synthase [Sedimentibacter sp.]